MNVIKKPLGVDWKPQGIVSFYICCLNIIASNFKRRSPLSVVDAFSLLNYPGVTEH